MSDIREWDSVAINNSDPSPNGYPEGMLPGGVNDSDRETMAAVRRKWQDADWFDWGHTITYVSATQFSIPSDVTAIYHIDRRVRAVMPIAGTVYGRITAVEFVTNTTVTVLWDSGQLALESGIQVSVGVQIANAASTSLPMYWIQNTFGLLNPDILCYQDKNAVDIDGGDIAKEVVLESLPNVQNQVANPTHTELNTLVGLDTGQTLEARLQALEAQTPIGTMQPWPSDNVASLGGTWLVCDGSAVSQTTYATLFALIGTTFGDPGGGNFNLPDLRGRTVFGRDVGNATGRLDGGRVGGVGGLDSSAVGNVGGEQEHIQTEDELAPHAHSITAFDTLGGQPPTGGAVNQDFPSTTGSTGGGLAMNNVPPGLVMNWVIKAL